ncbi:MAG: sporulation protein YqfD [Lachnospiraceae bacterium]|nr:sporulation protein YqfD [Lachnospiraceae bacterium]
MIEIIRYLKGYVRIRVSGYAPERFMNLCTNRRIILWGVIRKDGCYEMCIGLSDFFQIKDIVRKTKTKVAVLERFGLPFFVSRMLHRKMFSAGVIFCISFLILMSRFIWSIEFTGNEMITDEELINFLAAQNITYATSKNDLNLEELESSIREEFEQVTWASAELSGSKLTIELKENDLPTQEETEEELASWKEGADLVATASGTIYSILTRTGIPMVKEGDTVEKGAVIISGMVPVNNDDGTVREWERVTADGDVWISCLEPVEITQKLKYTYKNYTGREKKYRFVSVFGRSIRFPFGKADYVKYDEVTRESRLQLFGQIDLPVFYGNITCREYLPVDAVYDTQSAKKLLENRFQKIIVALEQKGVHIIQKDVKIVKKAEALVLKGNLIVHTKAVIRKAIQTQETQQESSEAMGE